MDQPPHRPGSGYAVRDRRWWTGEGERATDEAPTGPPTYVARLEAELADRDRRLEEMTARARAGEREVEQIKQRLERESTREIGRRIREVVAGWLGALDDLDRAIDAGRRGAGDEAPSGGRDPVLAGVGLVRHNLLRRLAEQGVARIEPTGEPFDPRRHEAIARVEVADPAAHGRVVETIAPGYAVGDDVLRPARVAVGARPTAG